MSRSAPLSRRTLLRAGLVTAAVGAAGVAGCAPAARARGPALFTLGVASGDPSPDGMVLWTRLARDPAHEDGLGGMPRGPVDVQWQVATDEGFGTVLASGTARTGPEQGYAVHAEPRGLPAGREFAYRFRVGSGPASELSPAGRTRTAPPPGQLGSLDMSFVSCARWDQGLFTAYRRLAEDRPDLVLHLGDYSYEYATTPRSVRQLAGGPERTLADYRRRYAQYHADPDLQTAHAVAPWVVVFDDHEVEDNWAGVVSEPAGEPNFSQRRAAAFQAYYENVPLRVGARPAGPSMRLYRRVEWGALATFHMLDTRQFRDDQACGDVSGADCPARGDPARSLMGTEQEAWLADGFARSTARWDLLGQQVMFSQLDLTPGLGHGFDLDAWDGYLACRDRVVDSWLRAGVRNPVVLSGDVHSHWASDVRTRFTDPAAPVVGTELVTTSIASGGDGSEHRPATAALLAENPHIRFFNNRRGYVSTRITPDAVTAEFRVVPYVSRPGAPVETRARFVVEDRRAGLNPA
ncbi:MAG TPA: alkaline phosphatase D family protein [Pseudonocardia sp.]